MSYEVIGVGHSCLDRICAVERYPAENESTHITSVSVQGGGAVATALVTLSRLGVSAAFIGVVGKDLVSNEIVRLFEEDGVSTSLLQRREDAKGLDSFVMVNPETGSRTKFPLRDTNPPILWTEEAEEAVRSAKVLHLDGTNWENAYRAAKIAKEAGVLVSLDGCSLQKDNEKNKMLASMADILIMNCKYPLRVSGRETYEDALLEIATWGPNVVVCTLGAEGELYVEGEKVYSLPPVEASPIVDTTGAGDVFHGAFIAGCLSGMGLVDNLNFASAVSALKCTKMGGREGIPSWDTAIKFWKTTEA